MRGIIALLLAIGPAAGPTIDLPPGALEPALAYYLTAEEEQLLEQRGGMPMGVLTEVRHRQEVAGVRAGGHQGMGAGVERWRWLVEAHFLEADVERALAIMACESGGNPRAKNRRSSASGLFQHLRYWWGGTFDPFVPEQSVRWAAHLRYETPGGWAHWRPSRHCWG